MSALTRLRNFWMLWVTTIVLACFSSAVARVSYKVTDLGTLAKDNLGCAMSLNNEGWTEIMAGYFEPGTQDSVPAYPLSGRAVMGIDGYKIDLGTLGGHNTWMMWGQMTTGHRCRLFETSVPGRTAKTFADWAHTLFAGRFFGNSSTCATSDARRK